MIYSLIFKKPRQLWHKLEDSYQVEGLETNNDKTNHTVIFRKLPFNIRKKTYILYWTDTQQIRSQLIDKEGKAQLHLLRDSEEIKFFLAKDGTISDIYTYPLNKVESKPNNLLISQDKINPKYSHLYSRLFTNSQCQDALEKNCNHGYVETGLMENSGLPYQKSQEMPLPQGF